MYEYSHGGNAAFEAGRDDIIDLSANINPLGMPAGVRDAIVQDIANCIRYPDNFSRSLRKKTAIFENVHPDSIFFGNGASDIIFRLPRAVQAKKIMIAAPTFADYERSGMSHGAEIIRYALDKDFKLDSAFIDMAYRAKADLIFICNPNNPTGLLTERGWIKQLLDCCKQIGARLAVDECFMDFTEQPDLYTSKVFLDKYTNLIIIKAFTKFFALAGIRLGYCICSDGALIESLYFHGADWPVSNLAQSAGIAALENYKNFTSETVQYLSQERQLLKEELKQLNYKVFDSASNYLFFQSPYSFDLREKLDGMGIRIRSCANYQGLDGSYYRVAVSTKENNINFIKNLKEISQ